MCVDSDVRENRRWTFSLEEVLLWKFWSAVIVWSENALMQDLFLTSMHLLALQDVNWKGKDMWPSMVCNSPFHHSKRTHTAVSSEHTHAHAQIHTHTHTLQSLPIPRLEPLTFRLHKPLWWTEVVWITCGLLWCFYQLFGLSFWRHPFTAEHPLVRYWCSDTFLQIWWKKKLVYIFDALRVSTFSANLYFLVTNSFNLKEQ